MFVLLLCIARTFSEVHPVSNIAVRRIANTRFISCPRFSLCSRQSHLSTSGELPAYTRTVRSMCSRHSLRGCHRSRPDFALRLLSFHILEDDSSTKFKVWREAINGASNSNFIKVDEILAEKGGKSVSIECTLIASSWVLALGREHPGTNLPAVYFAVARPIRCGYCHTGLDEVCGRGWREAPLHITE